MPQKTKKPSKKTQSSQKVAHNAAILEDIYLTLRSHSKILEAHSDILESHSKTIEAHTQILQSSYSQEFKENKKRWEENDKRFNQTEQKLDIVIENVSHHQNGIQHLKQEIA